MSSTRYIDGVPYTTRTAYRTDNAVDTIIYPNNFAVNYGYTALGYLAKVQYGNKVLYQTTGTNALNQLNAYSYGNGKSSSIEYQADGMPSRYLTSGVQDLNMSFDAATGNLLSRSDALKSQTETFTFNNALDRLNTISKGAVKDTITYFNNGNIDKKSKTGTYSYDGTRINAVVNINYSCGILHLKDSFLNVVKYTPFNQPDSIKQLNTTAGKKYTAVFTYGADHLRSKMVLQQDSVSKATRYYLGNYEKFIDSAGTVRHIYYINGGNGLCAIATMTGSNTIPQFYYTYTDHLGSILTMTDSTGIVKGEQSFDAWGRERNYKDWSKDTITQPVGSPFESVNSLYGYGNNAGWITRGYTGHEHLPQFDLINMNGRLYDPIVGRMLSPDNYVADPTNTQAYNRYTYVNNNPLKYTDPSGWLRLADVPVEANIDDTRGGGGGGSRYIGGLDLTGGGNLTMVSSMFYASNQLNSTYYNWSTGQYMNGKNEVSFSGVMGELQSKGQIRNASNTEKAYALSKLYGDGYSNSTQDGYFWVTWGSGGDNRVQINTKKFAYSSFGDKKITYAGMFIGNDATGRDLINYFNIGAGTGATYAEVILRIEKSRLQRLLANGENVAKDIRLLNRSIESTSRFSQKLGVAGLLLQGGFAAYDYGTGKGVTASQLFYLGVSTLLVAASFSNPIVLSGLAIYSILDMAGALDGFKESLGGNNIIIPGYKK